MTTNDQLTSEGITLDDVLQATQAVTSRFGDDYFYKLDKEEGFPHDYIKALMDASLHTVMIPEEYGGMGLGVREASVIVEEMHRSGGVGSMIHGQMFMMGILARHGSEQQKRKFLSEVVAGRMRLQSFSVTEPNAGTDTSKITTKAWKEGNEWVVKGQKVWTSRFDHADAFIVFARTSPPKDPAKPFQGLSCFIADKREVDPKQYTSRKIDAMFNHHTYEVFYDDMRIPEDSLIGEEGNGFKYLLDGLNAERVIIAAECIGDGRWFIEKAVKYANERVIFGRPIGANQGVQYPIARGYAHLEAANALRWKAAEMFDRHEHCGAEANMAKMLASEASWELANACMQTHGGFGLAREYHIERKFRENRVFQIAPISTNMVLNYIGQHVLGMPRSY
ncbi:acyl-CoA dehydrogenase [Caballeronia udeis]|uniref:Acyl-CoA dehydrogenase n=1 Tax=Caballeronia udeis TaxID=1232866 RepID=A0A158JTU3_9BURK|nr:acyl-CoA dehydrogenase family protein [Caballeronia udeis]SAL71730.1 acyl-CoA dehydrogenase [Caballeronia udeis]